MRRGSAQMPGAAHQRWVWRPRRRESAASRSKGWRQPALSTDDEAGEARGLNRSCASSGGRALLGPDWPTRLSGHVLAFSRRGGRARRMPNLAARRVTSNPDHGPETTRYGVASGSLGVSGRVTVHVAGCGAVGRNRGRPAYPCVQARQCGPLGDGATGRPDLSAAPGASSRTGCDPPCPCPRRRCGASRRSST